MSTTSGDTTIHLCSPEIDQSASFADALQAVQSSDHQTLAYFDSPLSGFINVPKLPNEDITSLSATFTVSGSETTQRFQIATAQLQPYIESDEGSLYRFSTVIPFPKTKVDDPIVVVQVQGTFSRKRRSGSVDGDSSSTERVRSGYPVDRRNILSGLAPLGGKAKSVLLDTLIKDNKVDIIPILEEAEEVTQEHREPSPQRRELNISTSIPIIRLLNLRIRNVRISKSSVLSTIDVESSSKVKERGIITALNGITHGFQRRTHVKFNHQFPIEVSHDDSYSFTFLLESFESINFKSLITVNYSCGSHSAVTKLLTNIDFVSPFPVKQSNSKNISSPNLNNNNSNNNNSNSNITNVGPSSLSSTLIVKFNGNKSVKLGVPFKLTVQVHNITRRPRNLVMVFNGANDGYIPQLPKIKSLVLPLTTVIRNYATSRLRPVGLLSLDNEVHLKADAGTVFETEIQLMGLETGVAPLLGTTITDISTGESMSCDKMLEIIVQ